MVCICRCTYPVNINELPFLLLEDEHNIENLISNFINLNNVIIKTNSIHTITTYLSTTKAIAILPKICVIDELKQGLLKEIELPESINKKYNLYLTYKNDISPSVKEKISYIAKNLKLLLNKKY